ncbi:MAG: hypothetical protein KIT10_05440 [Flavobacteriales bacterium]|nr:hypothetical protein [Flavobacteriales bacterium]
MQHQYPRPTKVDYNGIDEISRNLNRLLGDLTGRTVTQRTQDGIYRITNGQWDPSGEITHTIMAATLAGLVSRSNTGVLLGLAGLFFLAAAWREGAHEGAVRPHPIAGYTYF